MHLLMKIFPYSIRAFFLFATHTRSYISLCAIPTSSSLFVQYIQEVLSLCNTYMYEQFSMCNTYEQFSVCNIYEQFFLCVTHMSGSFIVRYIRAVFLQTYRRFVKHVTSFHLPLSVYISTHSSWEELIASDGSPLFQFRKFTGEPSRQENPSDKTNIKILSMGYSKGSVLDSSLKLISL